MIELQSSDYFLLFLSTFILTAILTPMMRRIAIRTDFLDRPTFVHKTHGEPIPYLGGVAIALSVLLISFGGLIYRNASASDIATAATLFGPALILAIIGLIDDRRSLPPFPRFVTQTLAGIFTAAIIIATETVGNPTGNSALDAAITVIWVVGICNSINFFDNLDGGAAGAVAVTSLGLFLIGSSNGQYFIAATAIATFAATLSFLIWNKSPAKIYMGDAGALFLGIVLSVLTVRLHPEVSGKTISFAIPLLLLAVPILDTSVAVTSRLRRRISIFQGGHDHLSHRLIRKGFTKREAAYALWSLAGIFTAIAVTLGTAKQSGTFLVYLAGLFWIALYLAFLNSEDQ